MRGVTGSLKPYTPFSGIANIYPHAYAWRLSRYKHNDKDSVLRYHTGSAAQPLNRHA
jgi:hypothetical protein